MAIFKVREPIETAESAVEVEIDEQDPLPPGTYLFELQVVDDVGNVSAPVQTKVVIEDPGPVAVIDAPETVPFGRTFKLSGERSHDVGRGSIAKYIWTLVDVE